MSHYHEQFLKQNPLAVLGVLRDLHKAAIPLRLSWNGGQLISKILAITPDKLVLDFGSQAEDNIAVLKAQHITITASHLMVCTTTPIFPHLRPTPSALFLPDQTGG